MSEKNTNVVTMKDGREVDFGVRGKLKKEIAVVDGGVTLTIDVKNGDTHSVTLTQDHPLWRELMGYGLSQKITDTVVKADDEDDISLGVERIINQLSNGEWTTRTPGEGLVRGFADLLEAIRRLRNYAEDSAEFAALKATLKAKSDDEIKVLKGNDSVKAIIAVIQSEKAAARAAKLSASVDGEAAAELAGL